MTALTLITTLLNSATAELATLDSAISAARAELPVLVDGTYLFEVGSPFWRIRRDVAGSDPLNGGVELEINFGRQVNVTASSFVHRAHQNSFYAHYAQFYNDADTLIGTGGSWSGGRGTYGWYTTQAGSISGVRRVVFYYTSHPAADLTAGVTLELPPA